MKNIFKSLLVPALALAVIPFFASCSEDRDENPTLRQPTGNLTMTVPAGAETTTLDLLNTESLTVTSTAPDYGFSSVILYQLQVSLSHDFTTLRTLGDVNQTYSSSTAQPEISFKCRELNDSIVSLYQETNNGENPSEDPMTVYLRVQASVNGSNTAYVYSSPVALSVIAQYVANVPDLYYIVGAMQGWNTSDQSCIFYPSTNVVTTQSYTTRWDGEATFKIFPGNDYDNWKSWASAYTAPTENDQSASGTIIPNNGGGNFKSPAPGEYYTFTIDMANMTYTWTKLDNQEPTEYKSIGITGDFNGWADGQDILMTEVSPHNWYVRATIPSEGGIKFRVDGAWTTSWGIEGDVDKAINVGDQFWGKFIQPGKNALLPAGTYDIYFNDITTEFVFVAAE